MGERLLCKQDVIGSSPLASTRNVRKTFLNGLDKSDGMVYPIQATVPGDGVLHKTVELTLQNLYNWIVM